MRRTKEIPISGAAKNRDHGKTFLITEMDADAAERWAARAMSALARSGAQIPPELITSGMAGFAAMTWGQGVGIVTGVTRAFLSMDPNDMEPLMAEMMTCVQRIEDRAVGGARPLVVEDIEEVQTRVMLRGEVLSLHLGFSLSEWLLRLKEAIPPKPSRKSKTFPAPSPRPSRRGKRP